MPKFVYLTPDAPQLTLIPDYWEQLQYRGAPVAPAHLARVKTASEEHEIIIAKQLAALAERDPIAALWARLIGVRDEPC